MAKRTRYKRGGLVNPMMRYANESYNSYEGGGMLENIAMGALGGAGGGLPGILLGAGKGLVSGILGDEDKQAQEKALIQQEIMQKQLQLGSRPTPQGGVASGITNPYRQLAFGGLTSGNPNDNLQTYEAGGSHEQNPLGGIPIGTGQNGNPNLVEEGEASFDFPDGKDGQSVKYVFSDRITTGDLGDVGLPSSIKNKTFADASKHIENLFKGRNAKMDLDTKKTLMRRLRDSQETIKQETQALEEQNQFAKGGNVYQNGGEIPYADAAPYTQGINMEQILNPLSYYGQEANARNPVETLGMGKTPPVPGVSTEALQASGYKPQASSTQPVADQGQFPWDKVATGASLLGQAAPLIGNIAGMRNMERPEAVQAETLDANIQPQLINRQQIQRNLVRQLATNRQALSERSGGDFGQFAANLQSLNRGSAGALADVTMQADVADAQERARAEQANLGIEKFNIGQRARTTDINAQNEAAYNAQRSAYSQGISQSVANIGKSLMNYQQARKVSSNAALANFFNQFISKK